MRCTHTCKEPTQSARQSLLIGVPLEMLVGNAEWCVCSGVSMGQRCDLAGRTRDFQGVNIFVYEEN